MIQLDGNQRGFTLLETIVAFTLFAGFAIVVYQALASAADRAHRTTLLINASLVAESVLARLGLDIKVRADSMLSGNEAGCRWSVAAAEFQVPFDKSKLSVEPLDISVTVQCGDAGAPVTLHSLYLSAKE